MPEKRLTPAVALRAICSGFLLGVAIASFENEISTHVWLSVAGAVILFLVIFYFERRVALLLLAALFAFVGLWLYEEHLPSETSVAGFIGQTENVVGTVAKVSESETTQHLTLSQLQFDDVLVEDRLLVLAPLFPKFEYGNRVSLRCDLESPEPLDGFRYDRYLAAKNIYATCFVASAPLMVEADAGDPLVGTLLRVRNTVIEQIDTSFGEPEASLLVGLILGEQRFSSEWDEKFVVTGTSHIVAASGYNVAIVTSIVFGFFIFLGLRRPRAFALIVAAIVVYVILAGAEAAVIRAGVMGILVLLSKQLGRKSTMTNVLLLTASVMLVINPFLLRDDVGFGLSMLSTVGLIYFAPRLEKRLLFLPEIFSIRDSVVATLSATLFTLPIIVFSFGRFSMVSILVNVLVLPLVPYAMLFGALAVAVSFVSSFFGMILAAPAWALLNLILFIIDVFASLPWAVINLTL